MIQTISHKVTQASQARRALLLGLAVTTALTGVAVSSSAVSAEPGALEEVIVTARKRNERLLDVPVAVSAVTAEQLQRYAITSIAAIAQQTPQLVVGETQNQVGASINLRGIGAGLSNPSTEQSVSLNLDGVQVSYGNAVRLGQFDLQRVEVLKGPQALFFGKNSPGGIVSLMSNDPGDSFEAQIRTGYEFYAKQRFAEGIISGPLTDTLGARLVGYYSKEDGWFRNTAVPIDTRSPGGVAKSPNAEDVFLRGTLAYRSTNGALRVKLKGAYSSRDRDGVGSGWISQPYYCANGGSVQNSAGLGTDCKLDRYYADPGFNPAAVALAPKELNGGVPFMKNRQSLASATVDYDLSDALTFTSVTGLYHVQDKVAQASSFSVLPVVVSTSDVRVKSFTQEVRLGSDFEGPLNFMVGAFYQDSTFKQRQIVVINNTATPSLSPIAAYLQDTKAWSAFAQLRYKFTEELELSGGGRLSRETKELSGTIRDTPFQTLRPKRKFKDFSPEVTLTYKPSSDLTAYAAYREGFTSGGFNTAPTTLRSPAFPALALRDVSFDQTTAKGGEVGVKGYLAERQVRFDLTGYHYKYAGLQLSKWDPEAFAQRTQNAGGAKVRGVELNLVAAPAALRGLEFRGSAAYNKGNFTDFIGGCYAGQSVAMGCNLLPVNPALDPSTRGTAANAYTSQDQSGQPLTRAPKWTLNGGVSYDHEINESLGASFALDANYTSSYVIQTEANPLAVQKGFWQLNANVTLYGGGDRDWQVALIGRNLTNKIYAVSGSVPPFTGAGTGTIAGARPSDIFGSVGAPRSVMLQLTLKSSVFAN